MKLLLLIMQAISRNKFISPSTAGTTNAAVLGVLLGYLMLGNQNVIIRSLFAFGFALLATIIFMLMLKKIKFKKRHLCTFNWYDVWCYDFFYSNFYSSSL